MSQTQVLHVQTQVLHVSLGVQTQVLHVTTLTCRMPNPGFTCQGVPLNLACQILPNQSHFNFWLDSLGGLGWLG